MWSLHPESQPLNHAILSLSKGGAKLIRDADEKAARECYKEAVSPLPVTHLSTHILNGQE